MKKQSYLPIALIIFYVISILAIMTLLDERNLQIKLVFLATSLALIIFSILLKVTQRVYWLTSYDYEDYTKMTETERLEISSINSKLIADTNILLCIYIFIIFISIYFNLNIFIDVLIFLVCILFMCFTDPMKLK